MKKKPKKRGGKRIGAGRPKKEPTQIVSFRVPKTIAESFRAAANKILKSYVKELKKV